jgi:serine protease Do
MMAANASFSNSGFLNSVITPARAAADAHTPAGFADVVAKVKPAVISVKVKIEQASQRMGTQEGDEDEAMPFPPGSPLEKYFKQFKFGEMPQAMPQMPRGKKMVTGEGSGFFISADGYAVTNNHVVDHARTVQVTTDDGSVYDAKVIGTDAKTDLALIKVDSDKTFAFVKFAQEDPRVGDWIVAVGNPFGLGGTVTAGIVSARGRDIGSGPFDDYIQIDAPINKGNSGGPAFNVQGEVVGVNTAIFSPSGGSVGIGFDIPANTAKTVVAQLKDHGSVERGWLGVRIQPVTSDIADSLGLKKAEGALVDESNASGPAAKAGIVAGDVIIAINDTAVKDARDLAHKIGTIAPGTSVKLTVLHKGDQKTIDLTIGTLSNEKQAKADGGSDSSLNGLPRLGLSLAPAKEVAGSGDQGVAVVEVDPSSLAAERGFKTGDVILEVAGKSVANATDVRKALSEALTAGKKTVLLRVKSAEATRFVALPIAKA